MRDSNEIKLPEQNVHSRQARMEQVRDQRTLVATLTASARELGAPELLAEAQALAEQYHAADHARLADDVYRSAAGEPASPSLGYFRASEHPEKLRALGAAWSDDDVRKLLKPNDSDFRAEIYLPDPDVFGPDRKPVISFKGSNGPVVAYEENGMRHLRESAASDWIENFRQGLGLESDHYNRAMDLAIAFQKGSQSGFETNGHSKGGGKALAAAAVTGQPAFTFNAATLHPKTALRYAEKNGGQVYDIDHLSNGYYVKGEVLHDGINLMHGMGKAQATQVTTLLRNAGELSQIPEAREQIIKSLETAFSYDPKMREGAVNLLDHLAQHSRAGTLQQIPGHAGSEQLIALDPKSRNAEGELVDRPARPDLAASSLAAAPLIAAAATATTMGVAGKRGGEVVAAAGTQVDRALQAAGETSRATWEITGNVANAGARNAGQISGAVVRYQGEVIAGARLAHGRLKAGSEELQATLLSWNNDLSRSLAHGVAKLPGLGGLDSWADSRHRHNEETVSRHRANAQDARDDAAVDAARVRQMGTTLEARIAATGAAIGDRLQDASRQTGEAIGSAYAEAGDAVRGITAKAPLAGASVGLAGGTSASLATAQPGVLAGAVLAKEGGAEAAFRHSQEYSVEPSMDAETRALEQNAIRSLQEARSRFPAHDVNAPPQALQLDDARHPLFPLYRDCERGVFAIDAQVARTPDLHSRQIAGAIAAEMAMAGGQRVDHVVLGNDASRIFGVQGRLEDPGNLRVSVDTVTAMQTPLEQSSERVAASLQPQADAISQQLQDQEQVRSNAMRMA